MSIQLELGVVVQEYDSGTRLGVYFPNQTYHYRVGSYDLSSVYSANMFAYLFRRINPEMAKKVVTEFETIMTGNAAGKEAFKTIISTIDWKPLLTGNAPLALTGTLKNAITTACDLALGAGVRSLLGMTSGKFNPYPPVTDGVLWANDSVNQQYILYAIDYWKKNPATGPAYWLSSATVRPK